MRQRPVKNLDIKLEENSRYWITEPSNLKGNWHDEFKNSNPIHIEVGSGKGKLISSLAKANPNINYIAFEGQADVAIRILEKASLDELSNLRVVINFVNDLGEYFTEGEIDGVYLSFSDPWPKARHEKRRLTYHKRIENYIKYCKSGFIEFRTDNDNLFDFSLEELSLLNITPSNIDRDFKAIFTTEYEDKFSSVGKNILHYRVDF